MNRLTSSILLAAIILSCSLSARPRRQGRAPARMKPSAAVIDGNRVMIIYGRPFSKNAGTADIRKIWGGLVPFDKIWRTGADEATLLISKSPSSSPAPPSPATPPSASSRFPPPTARANSSSTNRSANGASSPAIPSDVYDEKNDVVRADMTKSDLDTQVDQFEMSI